MNIDLKEIDQSFRSELDSILIDELGLSFSRGIYSRILGNGIVQLVMLDVKNGRKSCRVVIGLNATFLTENATSGALFVQYLTPGAITDHPAEIKWRDKESLCKAASLIAQAVRRHLRPWLERYSNLEALAESVRPEYDYLKGIAYLCSGNIEKARLWLHRYRSRIAQDKPSKEQQDVLHQVEELLESIVSRPPCPP